MLKNQIFELNEEKYDSKKKVDELQDEIMKLEEKIYHLHNKLRLLAAQGLISHNEVAVEIPAKLLKKFDPKNSSNKASNNLFNGGSYIASNN